MIAIILNSGMGSRMGVLTKDRSKCLLEISPKETMLTRQIRILMKNGISDFIITTGKYDKEIRKAIYEAKFPAKFTFIKNELYDQTNYIYSMYLIKEILQEEIVILHGDLVFDEDLMKNFLKSNEENVTMVYKGESFPLKDFKVKINEDGAIRGISVDYKEDCQLMMPIYKFRHEHFQLWQKQIQKYINIGLVNVYAENALNEILHSIQLKPHYYEKEFCREVDTKEDFIEVLQYFKFESDLGII